MYSLQTATKMQTYPPTLGLKALLLLAGLALTAACSGGSSSSVGGGGGTGNDPIYAWEDLTGDWIGQLVPAAGVNRARNVYLRWVDERITEAAESGGSEWTAANSTRAFKFNRYGSLSADLKFTVGSNRLVVQATMDDTYSTITGTFTLTDGVGSKVSGTLTLTRSSGPDQFEQADLDAGWDGLGRNGAGKFRFLKFELDATGAVLNGLMRHPTTEVKIRDYSPGAATFVFTDSSIGRIDNVVMFADQGQTITFGFLLMDLDGTLLAGPGIESDLGAGIAELVRGN
jgi:hypothetical protein